MFVLYYLFVFNGSVVFMEIRKTTLLEYNEPASRAMASLENSDAVIITREGKYCGLLDKSCFSRGIRELNNVKCESLAIEPPVLGISASILERVNGFLGCHEHALAIVDERQRPMGVTTRIDLLSELASQKVLPELPLAQIMNAPAYSISENETVGRTRAFMKEKNVRRLVVVADSGNSTSIRGGNSGNFPKGVLTEFDISASATKSNLGEGRKNIAGNSTLRTDDMKISGFVQSNITTVDESAGLGVAVSKMIKNNTSTVLVLAGKKPVGIISAVDVFKIVADEAHDAFDSVPISISGLPSGGLSQQEHIKQKIGHVLEKFSKTFRIRNATFHVREKKSAVVVNLVVDTDDAGRIAISHERPGFTEVIDEVASELAELLGKKKDKRVSLKNVRRRG